MTNPGGASDQLMTLVLQAVNHGLELVAAEQSFMPVMISSAAITVLATDTMDEAVAAVHSVMDSGQVDCCAFVYDSYLTVSGERTDAIMVEGYQRGQPAPLRFAQRYRKPVPAGFLRKARPLERLGNLKYLAGNAEIRTIQQE